MTFILRTVVLRITANQLDNCAYSFPQLFNTFAPQLPLASSTSNYSVCDADQKMTSSLHETL